MKMETIEIKLNGEGIADDIERSIIECRRRLIEAVAEERGISVEEMTRIADDISDRGWQDVRSTLSDCENAWQEFAVEGNEIE